MTDLLARLDALAPTIAAAAPAMEKARRLPPDIAAALAGTGAFRMIVPQAIGGLECEPATIVRAIARVARADASAGWCVMIGATSTLYSAYLPPDLAREIYGPADTISGGVFAPMGRAVADGDAYVVDGHWRWASGSLNCRWLNGGCTVLEDGALRKLPNGNPEIRAMIFPAADVELIDTWHTMGLCASGSVDMKVAGLRVPRARSVSLLVDRPRADGALYAFPAFGLLAIGIAAVALGNARAALDHFIARAADSRTAGARRSLAERGTARQSVAQMAARLGSAQAWLFESIDRAWHSATTDRHIDVDTRAALRLAATHLTRTAADVCRDAQDLAGGAAVFLDDELQRRLRDAQTMTAHMMVAPATYELAGRVLFGVPTDDTLL